MITPHPDLGLPAPLTDNGVRVVPLGGLGEVGRNMTIIEHAGQLLVVDCGVLFPGRRPPRDRPDPADWSHYADRLDDVQAIVLTHGHEGPHRAVPYLLRERPGIPLIGSQKDARARRGPSSRNTRSRPTRSGCEKGIASGSDCEFVAVNHSIPDALAVMIRTPGGRFSIQDGPAPLDGRLACQAFQEKGGPLPRTTRPTPRCQASRLGQEISPTSTRSSGTTERRIIVACFSSHIAPGATGARCGRERRAAKVAMVGRSMIRNMGIAADLGYLKGAGRRAGRRQATGDLPDHRIVLICTGSQGEPTQPCRG